MSNVGHGPQVVHKVALRMGPSVPLCPFAKLEDVKSLQLLFSLDVQGTN